MLSCVDMGNLAEGRDKDGLHFFLIVRQHSEIEMQNVLKGCRSAFCGTEFYWYRWFI